MVDNPSGAFPYEITTLQMAPVSPRTFGYSFHSDIASLSPYPHRSGPRRFLKTFRRRRELISSTHLPTCNCKKARQYWTFTNERAKTQRLCDPQDFDSMRDSQICDIESRPQTRLVSNTEQIKLDTPDSPSTPSPGRRMSDNLFIVHKFFCPVPEGHPSVEGAEQIKIFTSLTTERHQSVAELSRPMRKVQGRRIICGPWPPVRIKKNSCAKKAALCNCMRGFSRVCIRR